MSVPVGLDALRDRIATVTPAGFSTAVANYVYPTDYASISFATLPITITAEAPNHTNELRASELSAGRYQYLAETLVFLQRGWLDAPVKEGPTEQAAQAWVLAVFNALFDDVSLGGNVLRIGEEAEGGLILSERKTHIEWGQDIFWGVRFLVPIVEELR